MNPFLIPLPIIIVMVGYALYILYKKFKVGGVVEKWAQKHGHSFYGNNRDWWEHLEGTPFGKGHTLRGNHGVRTAADPELRAFQYEFTTGGGKNKKQHIYTITTRKMPYMAPDLEVKPEHLGHKLWDAVGGEDIDFESDEFSRKYWVTCRDRKFAYDVLHPRMMDALLNTKMGWTWNGDDLWTFQKGFISPRKIENGWKTSQIVAENLPTHQTTEKTTPSS